MQFTVIPQDTFEQLQMNAGVLLKSFDPTDPEVTDSNLITATTGGISVSCVPTYSDLGADVDNCPNNLKEMKHVDSWECKFSTTALGTSPELIRMSLGAADINATTGAITPRKDLDQDDFADIWWVGDKAGGGLVAVKLINALSTSGFSLQTTKNGKGTVSLELTGHVSIEHQDVMPMVFYSTDGGTTTTYTYTEVTPVGTENPVTEGWYVLVGDVYRLTGDTAVDENVIYYERTESS